MSEIVLLGDEAVALGAIHAGITAYVSPGTPSTEIFEFLLRYQQQHGRPIAHWCANEKTAYEAGLGVSLAGRAPRPSASSGRPEPAEGRRPS